MPPRSSAQAERVSSAPSHATPEGLRWHVQGDAPSCGGLQSGRSRGLPEVAQIHSPNWTCAGPCARSGMAPGTRPRAQHGIPWPMSSASTMHSGTERSWCMRIHRHRYRLTDQLACSADSLLCNMYCQLHVYDAQSLPNMLRSMFVYLPRPYRCHREDMLSMRRHASR
jgi:hypothetical protein